MDFEFAAEHESFRKEFRDWLATNLPPELCLDDASDDRVASDRETFERRRVWQRKMHAAGWVGITWPKEYGGRDAGLIERVIWDEEYTAARAPVLPGNMGLSLVGPTIIHWAPRSRSGGTCPRSSTPTRFGARAFPSRAPAPIWRASARARSTRATTSSSTARRCGPRARTSRTGSSCSSARTPTCPSTRGSAAFSFRWPRRESRSVPWS